MRSSFLIKCEMSTGSLKNSDEVIAMCSRIVLRRAGRMHRSYLWDLSVVQAAGGNRQATAIPTTRGYTSECSV